MIPLSVPNICGNEWKYVKDCLDTEWVSSAGQYVDLFEKKISQYSGSKYAIACVNGTSALQVSLRLLGVKVDDEVIIPTLTFIAPVNSIRYNNAYPIFMDVDDFYNIDSQKTIDFIKKETFFSKGFSYNKKTKRRISAIIPIHMWGNAAQLDDLIIVCRDRNIRVLEDASESLGTFYNDNKKNNRHSGTIGDIGCFSFNGNKIITAGGGGMIITDNEKIADKARYLTTQAKDDPVRYIHNEIGYNFRLTNTQAAIGVAQFENLNNFLKRKSVVYNQYKNEINRIPGLEIADVPNYGNNNHWMIILKINDSVYGKNREETMQHLLKNGVQTRPAWAAINQQKPYRKYQTYNIDKAYKLIDSSLCLPSSTNLSETDQQKVISLL